MEIILVITISMLALLILALVGYFLCCLTVFICQEINSSVKKMRRDIRGAIWDLEWKWKMLKRRK